MHGEYTAPGGKLVAADMIEHFRRRHGLTRRSLTADELRAARELTHTKFRSREWTTRVP